jgi:hypothetical protein
MRPVLPSVAALSLAALLAAGCSSKHRTYAHPNMDFGSIRTIVVLPLWNLSKDPQASDRVRDVFTNALLATNAVYVVPTGEVMRAVSRVNMPTPVTPTTDEVVKLCALLKADAVITGVLKEYGEVRTSSAVSNVVSLSLQMQEASTGKVVWSGASSKGGVGWGARLLGSAGGRPANEVTEQVVDDLLEQMLK